MIVVSETKILNGNGKVHNTGIVAGIGMDDGSINGI